MILLKLLLVNKTYLTILFCHVIIGFVVHIGGGLWGIFAVPIFRRTVGPTVNGGFAEDTFYSIIYRISVGESWRVKL
jgi:hypothetical protein